MARSGVARRRVASCSVVVGVRLALCSQARTRTGAAPRSHVTRNYVLCPACLCTKIQSARNFCHEPVIAKDSPISVFFFLLCVLWSRVRHVLVPGRPGALWLQSYTCERSHVCEYESMFVFLRRGFRRNRFSVARLSPITNGPESCISKLQHRNRTDTLSCIQFSKPNTLRSEIKIDANNLKSEATATQNWSDLFK